jgi:CheY-like chemotaxis protein
MTMSGESILIVDDNEVNLRLAHWLLASEGFTVRVAKDAEEAFGILDDFHPRLILMDIQMPGMDGLTATRKLKEDPKTRGIMVIALTAFAMSGDRERALAAGCEGYVTKPIDTRTLPGLISGYLAAGPAN